MVTDAFSLNMPRPDVSYQLRDLPDEWRITDSIAWSDYSSSPVLDHSNYETIMARLRTLDGVVEGNLRSSGYPDYQDIIEPDNADWFEYSGYIAWKSSLTEEQYLAAKKRGHIEAIDPDDPIPCPVLNCLLEIRYDLSQYPVLDDEDYSERETEAALAAIDCCAPLGMRLTADQQYEIYRFLTGDGDGRFTVEFHDDDYSVWDRAGHGDLDDAVKHACFVLGYLPLHKHGEYERTQPKRPYRTKTRHLVFSWFKGRIPYAGLAYIDRRGLRQALINARAKAKEQVAA